MKVLLYENGGGGDQGPGRFNLSFDPKTGIYAIEVTTYDVKARRLVDRQIVGVHVSLVEQLNRSGT